MDPSWFLGGFRSIRMYLCMLTISCDQAVAFGKASAEPPPEALYRNIYSSNKEGFKARGVDRLGAKTLL